MDVKQLRALLLKSPRLAKFEELVNTHRSLLVENLWNPPKAALAALAHHKKNVVLITEDAHLWGDLNYFNIGEGLDFPSWETLPAEEIAPSLDIIGKRFEILHTLLERKQSKHPSLLLCSLQACLQKQLSPHTLLAACKRWKTQDSLSFQEAIDTLLSLGYQRRSVASDKGEFAVRGGILDVFPLAAQTPYRLDFFGDTLDQIRTYDPIGQKSTGKVEHLFLCPASELAMLPKEQNPVFLFNYFSQDTLIIFDDLLALEDKYIALKKMPGAISPFFASIEELLEHTKSYPCLFWTKERVEELSEVSMGKKVGRAFYTGEVPVQSLSFDIFGTSIHTHRWAHPFQHVSSFFCASENKVATTQEEVFHAIQRFPHLSVHLISTTPTEESALKEKLHREKIVLPSQTTFEIGSLSCGFVITDTQETFVSLAEWTHRHVLQRQKWRHTYHTPPSDFHELQPGDVVVHFHHGIGKFRGIEKQRNHLGEEAEFLIIEYAESSKLFVPLAQSHLVSRYIGSSEEVPTFSTLGSSRWHNTRVQAQQAIIGYAEQLLRLNAERAVRGGFQYPPDSSELCAFEREFPFVETDDQLQAIEALKQDMISSKAMDRLICGDVGYGKTEVAMRAAFKAVCDGKKQVAVLVPTTILAMQHYETFSERMANFPVTIGIVSRFRPAKEVKETIKKVAEGHVDILIGTHRMVSKDIQFKDLGLLIIDEEQRFGVRAKESLKALKHGVDCLTLSATPIPRTLYMSLVGARDISVINTPPQDRLPIKTILAEKSPSTIQNALLRELTRGGQAYFIHNRVESIFDVTETLQSLLPEARIVTGHGQMPPEELDAVFHAFKNGSADILVATTIVENGIDIPNANTILIDRADQFGLADLYQLRGRVGRWKRPAYAYFLTPLNKQLSEVSRKRLYALVEASGYGGGMKIAMRDLEIRGAGDILGTKQSGQIASIGFHLYCKLLKRTIDALKHKTGVYLYETKMEFSYPASIPEFYIGDTSLRMELYHRLGDVTSNEEIDAILAELQDRFGPCPSQVLWLYHLTKVRLFASHNQFILLKFDKMTFTMERQTAKQIEKKTVALPTFQDPEQCAHWTIQTLSRQLHM